MSRLLVAAALVPLAFAIPAHTQESKAAGPGHYLFAWSGDQLERGNDFIAVIDADPQSPSYGRLVSTAVTDQKSMQVRHTEYTSPQSGMLFANDHAAGRTFVFNINDPLHPTVATSFGDLAGFEHPHSFIRLPNGHVLATFQHVHQHHGGAGPGSLAMDTAS
jgi:hypothetical protein